MNDFTDLRQCGTCKGKGIVTKPNGDWIDCQSCSGSGRVRITDAEKESAGQGTLGLTQEEKM